jgi:hypothetical protein
MTDATPLADPTTAVADAITFEASLFDRNCEYSLAIRLASLPFYTTPFNDDTNHLIYPSMHESLPRRRLELHALFSSIFYVASSAQVVFVLKRSTAHSCVMFLSDCLR